MLQDCGFVFRSVSADQADPCVPPWMPLAYPYQAPPAPRTDPAPPPPPPPAPIMVEIVVPRPASPDLLEVALDAGGVAEDFSEVSEDRPSADLAMHVELAKARLADLVRKEGEVPQESFEDLLLGPALSAEACAEPSVAPASKEQPAPSRTSSSSGGKRPKPAGKKPKGASLTVVVDLPSSASKPASQSQSQSQSSQDLDGFLAPAAAEESKPPKKRGKRTPEELEKQRREDIANEFDREDGSLVGLPLLDFEMVQPLKETFMEMIKDPTRRWWFTCGDRSHAEVVTATESQLNLHAASLHDLDMTGAKRRKLMKSGVRCNHFVREEFTQSTWLVKQYPKSEHSAALHEYTVARLLDRYARLAEPGTFREYTVLGAEAHLVAPDRDVELLIVPYFPLHTLEDLCAGTAPADQRPSHAQALEGLCDLADLYARCDDDQLILQGWNPLNDSSDERRPSVRCAFQHGDLNPSQVLWIYAGCSVPHFSLCDYAHSRLTFRREDGPADVERKHSSTKKTYASQLEEWTQLIAMFKPVLFAADYEFADLAFRKAAKGQMTKTRTVSLLRKRLEDKHGGKPAAAR